MRYMLSPMYACLCAQLDTLFCFCSWQSSHCSVANTAEVFVSGTYYSLSSNIEVVIVVS